MIYIIVSVLLFSFNNVLWKKNLKDINTFFLISYRALINSLIGIIALIFLLQSLPNTGDFLKITFGSVLGAFGLFFMLIVIKKHSLQWLGVYNLLGILITYLHLYFFENLSGNTPQLGLILIIIGYLIYVFFNNNKSVKLTLKEHTLLILMIICFTYSSIIHWKNLTNDINPILIITNQEVIVFLLSFLIIFKNYKNQIRITNYKINFIKVIVMSLIVITALYFSFIGIKITDPLISAILFLATPLTTITFSALFFKEKITTKEIIAIIIICFGAFLIHKKTTL